MSILYLGILPPPHATPTPSCSAGSIGIAGYNLAVEHCRFSWELVQQLGDRREALGKVVPVTAVDDNSRACLVGLHSIAVELHFV